MVKNLRIIGILLFAFCTHSLFAQDPEPTRILYQDDFNDTATDSAGICNIGWIRFGPEQNLEHSIVEQRNDALYMRIGSFGLLGGVVAQTNGLPKYILGDSTTKAHLIANNFSHPNQVFRFRVNFVKMSTSNFILTTRQLQDKVDPDTTDFIVSNITNKAAYALHLDPLKNKVTMAKYPSDTLSVLDVSGPTWTLFGTADFSFSLGTWYWAKLYLYEKSVKAKVWSGNLEDEPVDWLLAAQDDSVWTRGKYSTFIMTGLPPNPVENGDVVMIDDVLVEGFGEVTDVATEPAEWPYKFALHQNYPNPFNPETAISYQLAAASDVTLTIFDQLGREVLTFVRGSQPAGSHRVVWDGRDKTGQTVASGIYLYLLQAGSFVQMRKMLLIR
jgi:hypothetical protein